MLVLSRTAGESLIIDDNIKVHILQVNGETIKVGIEAPRHISIYRQELYEEIRNENKSAGRTTPEDLQSITLSLNQKDTDQEAVDAEQVNNRSQIEEL